MNEKINDENKNVRPLKRDGRLFPCYHPNSHSNDAMSTHQRTTMRVPCNVGRTSWLTGLFSRAPPGGFSLPSPLPSFSKRWLSESFDWKVLVPIIGCVRMVYRALQIYVSVSRRWVYLTPIVECCQALFVTFLCQRFICRSLRTVSHFYLHQLCKASLFTL